MWSWARVDRGRRGRDKAAARGGERRERVAERKGSGFKLNFLKVSNINLKNFEHKVVGNLKIYDFHFGSKFI
jgi:hypothetical protein